jgi:hypothetical protein
MVLSDYASRLGRFLKTGNDRPASEISNESYKWYYFNDMINETNEAIQAALDNFCGLLVWVGKPYCEVDDNIWSDKDFFDGTGKMAKYLKDHQLVGLRINESLNTFANLRGEVGYFRNYDGGRGGGTSPWFVLMKVKDESRDVTELSFSRDIDVFFGVYGSDDPIDKTYEKVTAWIESLMDPDLVYIDGQPNYLTAFDLLPEDTEPPEEPISEPEPDNSGAG